MQNVAETPKTQALVPPACLFIFKELASGVPQWISQQDVACFSQFPFSWSRANGTLNKVCPQISTMVNINCSFGCVKRPPWGKTKGVPSIYATWVVARCVCEASLVLLIGSQKNAEAFSRLQFQK